MGEGMFTQLGLGGIIIVMVLRLVFDFLKNRKEDGNMLPNKLYTKIDKHIDEQTEECELVKEIYENTKWLKEIHDVRDEDGLPVWYVKTSLENAIKELSKNISAQTQVLVQLMNEFKSYKK